MRSDDDLELLLPQDIAEIIVLAPLGRHVSCSSPLHEKDMRVQNDDESSAVRTDSASRTARRQDEPQEVEEDECWY